MSRLAVLVAVSGLAGCTALLGFGERVESADDTVDGGTGAGAGGPTTNDAGAGAVDGGADVDGGGGGALPENPYVDPTFGTDGRVFVPSDPFASTGATYQCAATVDGDALWLACTDPELDRASGVLDRIATDGTVTVSRQLSGDAYFGLLSTPAGLLAVGLSGTVNDAVRLLGDGAGDPAFGAPSASVGKAWSRARGLAPDGAGGYLVWGEMASGSAAPTDGYAATLSPPPSSFGAALVTDPLTTSRQAFSARTATRLDASTVLLAGEMGSTAGDGARSLAVVRFSGASASVLATYPAAPAASLRVVAATTDAAHAVVAGVSDESTSSVLTRILPNGTFDATFGQNGVLSLAPPAGAPLGSVTLEPRAILPLANGNLLVGGRAILASGTSRAFLTRLRPDGTADPTFAGGGYAYPRLFAQPTFEEIDALALRADGAVYAVGSAESPNSVVEHFVLRFP
jgi:hypothetical protein